MGIRSEKVLFFLRHTGNTNILGDGLPHLCAYRFVMTGFFYSNKRHTGGCVSFLAVLSLMYTILL